MGSLEIWERTDSKPQSESSGENNGSFWGSDLQAKSRYSGEDKKIFFRRSIQCLFKREILEPPLSETYKYNNKWI